MAFVKSFRAAVGSRLLVLCKSSLTPHRHEIRYGTMSYASQKKFLGGFRPDERFLNNSSVANSFKLIARFGSTPVYKGRKPGTIFLCQHGKIFFKIRQKSTSGLMTVGDNGLFVRFLTLVCWRDGFVIHASGWCGITFRNTQSHAKAKVLPQRVVNTLGRTFQALSMNDGASWAAWGHWPSGASHP